MATLSTPKDVAELQVAFLQADNVTPDLLRDTLEALLSQEATTAPNLNLWVSMAVLHTLTDAQLATKITSIEALSALLAVGLRASNGLRNSTASGSSTSLTQTDQASLAIPSQLHIIQSSFEAWGKTGMVARTQETSGVIWPGDGEDDEEEEEDEEAAWFDSKATPSPMPTAAPSILLSALISALSKPQQLASLIAPYPDRLAVWLRSLPSSLYLAHVWPHRLEIIKRGLVHNAIAGDDIDVVHVLALSQLLPLPSERGEETGLWTTLRSDGQKSETKTQPLVGRSDPMQGPEIAEWYLTLGRLLASAFHATSISAALADAVMKTFSKSAPVEGSGLQHTLQQLARLSEECHNTATHMTGVATPRELLADPSHQILRLSSENPTDVSKMLGLIASRTGRHPNDVAREVLFEAYTSANVSPEQLRLLLSEASSGDAGQAQHMLISMLLASKNGRNCSLLAPATDQLASSARGGIPQSIAQIFPRLERHGRVDLLETPVLPSVEGVYRALQEEGQFKPSGSSLAERCKAYLLCVSQEGPLADGLQDLPPFTALLAAGNKNIQTVLAKKLVASVSKAGLDDATSWLNLSDDLLELVSGDKLLDALDRTDVVGELLHGALLSSHSDAAYSLLIGRLPSLPGPQLDGLLIASARELFDRVQGGRPAVSDLRTVRNIISLSSSDVSSANMTASQAFLKAVLRLMQLSHPLSSSLHPSLLMSPVEIRLTADKIDIIRHWLGSTNDTAWRREDDVLDTAWGLVQGSGTGLLGDAKQTGEVFSAQMDSGKVEADPVPSKSMVKVRVLALLAEAAISNGDLSLTTQYVESMLQSFRALLKRSRRLSANRNPKVTSDVSSKPATVAQTEAKRGQETVWTTLFLLSKHPSCTDAAATRRWLAEGLAYAPEERVADLLKRWRALPAPAGGESVEIFGSGSTRVDGGQQQQQRAHPSSSSTDESAAAYRAYGSRTGAATSSAPGLGLGSGVFSLAAAAVNRSHWPLRLGSSGGAGGPSAAHPATAGGSQSSARFASATPGSTSASAGAGAGGLSLGTSGVGNALSSLAGQLGEGYGAYGSRLTGFLSATSGASGGGGSGSGSGASLAGGGGRSSRPATPSFTISTSKPTDGSSPSAPYSAGHSQGAADPLAHAPSSTRSAAQLFDDAAAGHTSAGGGGGWAALGTRGMGWLMGEEER